VNNPATEASLERARAASAHDLPPSKVGPERLRHASSEDIISGMLQRGRGADRASRRRKHKGSCCKTPATWRKICAFSGTNARRALAVRGMVGPCTKPQQIWGCIVSLTLKAQNAHPRHPELRQSRAALSAGAVEVVYDPPRLSRSTYTALRKAALHLPLDGPLHRLLLLTGGLLLVTAA
jgi:hypothetical protein